MRPVLAAVACFSAPFLGAAFGWHVDRRHGLSLTGGQLARGRQLERLTCPTSLARGRAGQHIIVFMFTRRVRDLGRRRDWCWCIYCDRRWPAPRIG